MASISYVYIAACFFISFNCINALEAVDGKIKITVGTTAGCSDTVNFITTQLTGAYAAYRDFLEVEFVPWGRTTRNVETDVLSCQFQANDCWANRVHRCALDMLRGNQDAQVHYMTCEFSPPHPAFLQGSYLCAQAVGLNLIALDNCVFTTGRPLDVAAEEAAREPMEIINFVPSIHFNDNIDVALHNQARSRLQSMICFALADDVTTGVTNCQIYP